MSFKSGHIFGSWWQSVRLIKREVEGKEDLSTLSGETLSGETLLGETIRRAKFSSLNEKIRHFHRRKVLRDKKMSLVKQGLL